MRTLTKNEEQVLLAVLKLGDTSYLVTIRDYLRKKTGKEPSFGTLHVLLKRLERERLVRPRTGEASARRGGKAIRYYHLSREGIAALRAAQCVNDALWSDFDRMVSESGKGR